MISTTVDRVRESEREKVKPYQLTIVYGFSYLIYLLSLSMGNSPSNPPFSICLLLF
jgi:hypothetical protein